MIKIKVDISDVVRGLDTLQSVLDNMAPALKEAALYMERETKLNIARGQTFDGGTFAPLAQSTLRTKRGGRILHETGAMVSSISVKGVSGAEARVGPSIRYAVFHQFGTVKMPARPFVGVAPRHEPALQKIVEDYLRSAS